MFSILARAGDYRNPLRRASESFLKYFLSGVQVSAGIERSRGPVCGYGIGHFYRTSAVSHTQRRIQERATGWTERPMIVVSAGKAAFYGAVQLARPLSGRCERYFMSAMAVITRDIPRTKTDSAFEPQPTVRRALLLPKHTPCAAGGAPLGNALYR
jgi:hypothetical protein